MQLLDACLFHAVERQSVKSTQWTSVSIICGTGLQYYNSLNHMSKMLFSGLNNNVATHSVDCHKSKCGQTTLVRHNF